MRWCRAEAGLVSETTAYVYDKAAVGALLQQTWNAMPHPDRIVIANVGGPEVRAAVEAQAAALWGLTPVFVAAQRKGGGVVNAYAEPGRLGADRWAAMIAAWQRLKGAACVVDCGTAMTIDVLGTEGRHQGGLILPGLNMLRRSLIGGTSDLRLRDGDTPARRPQGKATLLAADTSDAIQAGTLYMVIAAIDRICHDVGADLGVALTRVITGGDAPAVLPLLSGDYIHEPNLVLQGLAIIAGENA